MHIRVWIFFVCRKIKIILIFKVGELEKASASINCLVKGLPVYFVMRMD